MTEHGFRIDPGWVRGDLFSESGKWKYVVAIDMRKYYSYSTVHAAVVDAFGNTPAADRGVNGNFDGSGYWLVVTEPYHETSFPVMVRL